MFTIDFYETADGHSDVREFLEDLQQKSSVSKDARIQYQQLARYIWLLQENGTHLPQEITKHLEDDIWELRPGNNRVFYFFCKDDTYVLLHHFRRCLRRHHEEKYSVLFPKCTITFPERRNNHELE